MTTVPTDANKNQFLDDDVTDMLAVTRIVV